MKVRWTSQAELDRVDILAYIAGDNVRAAIAMDDYRARQPPPRVDVDHLNLLACR